MRVYTAEGGAVLHEFYNLRTILPFVAAGALRNAGLR